VRYVERQAWSILYDAEMVRISSAREGREFHALIPFEPSKTYRERRDLALDAIEHAIQSGRDPGEVTVQ
jgi:hypothetical protein